MKTNLKSANLQALPTQTARPLVQRHKQHWAGHHNHSSHINYIRAIVTDHTNVALWQSHQLSSHKRHRRTSHIICKTSTILFQFSHSQQYSAYICDCTRSTRATTSRVRYCATNRSAFRLPSNQLDMMFTNRSHQPNKWPTQHNWIFKQTNQIALVGSPPILWCSRLSFCISKLIK